MPPAYDWICHDCADMFDQVVPYAARDEEYPCPHCGSKNTIRQFPTPMVLQASYPDGMRRKGWQDVKEASKLSVEAASSSTENKKAIEKEIRNKLRVNIQK